MKERYKTRGVCAGDIDFEIVDGIIKNVVFTRGCDGNLQGISRLVEGMSAKDAMVRLEGIRCGRKDTSCPDQLAKAIRQSLDRGGENGQPKNCD